MSQHDFNIANQGFPAFRSDLNDALVALASTSLGSTAPSTTYSGLCWLDSGTANKYILKVRNADDDAWITVWTLDLTTDTANLALKDAAQTFTASQRGTVTTDNDGSFDMSVTNNFKCTPTGNFTLTFTNITAGQSGFILLVNSGGYTVSAHANTKVSTTALATISAAGTYLLSYFTDGTNVYVVNSGALA
jgi:hypothetical protein